MRIGDAKRHNNAKRWRSRKMIDSNNTVPVEGLFPGYSLDFLSDEGFHAGIGSCGDGCRPIVVYFKTPELQ